MKKLLATLIVSCLLLSPLPAFAMGQDIFVNDIFVERGMNTGVFRDGEPIGGPTLHGDAVKVAKALGLSASLDGYNLTVEGQSVNIHDIGGELIDNGAGAYMPLNWLEENLNLKIEGTDQTGFVSSFNITLPGAATIAKNAPITPLANGNIYVNDTILKTDKEPVIRNGRVYIPIRPLFEYAGANVNFTKAMDFFDTVRIETNGTYLEFRPGRSVYGIGDQNFDYDSKDDGYYVAVSEKSFIRDGRTYIPLRLISELFGAKVDWDDQTKTVSIRGSFSKFIVPEKAKKCQYSEFARSNFDYVSAVYGA